MKKPYILLFIALLVAYLILALTLPSDPQVLAKHELTQLSARFLNLTILIPISLVYLAALYGFIRVKDYAAKVRDTKEGPHFKDIANGLMLLAFSLPINSILCSRPNGHLCCRCIVPPAFWPSTTPAPSRWP